MPQWIKNHESPKWIEVDKNSMTAKASGIPTIQESGLEIKDIQSIIEYYSR
jgi:ribosomal protein S4